MSTCSDDTDVGWDDCYAGERVLDDFDDKGAYMYIIIADCIFTS